MVFSCKTLQQSCFIYKSFYSVFSVQSLSVITQQQNTKRNNDTPCAQQTLISTTEQETGKQNPHLDYRQCLAHKLLPLRYDFIGIREVAINVVHLERVSVAYFVVCAAVVGGFDHDDITSRAAEINGVALTGQLSAHQTKRQCCTTES